MFSLASPTFMRLFYYGYNKFILLLDFLFTYTVNSLSIKSRGYCERTRWDGSCNNPLGFLTVADDILYFEINDS
jgi:hypothetical protein